MIYNIFINGADTPSSAEFLKSDIPDISDLDNNKWFAEESKQIVPNQTAPPGAVWSGNILFAQAFPK